MWRRKNRFERSIDVAETKTAERVNQLAEQVRERFDSESGQQLADNLNELARRVDDLDLSKTVYKRRKDLEKAARRANKQIDRAVRDLEQVRGKVAHDASLLAARVGEQLEERGQQIATVGIQSVPSQPTGWIIPILFGFLIGFGAGFLIARNSRQNKEEAA